MNRREVLAGAAAAAGAALLPAAGPGEITAEDLDWAAKAVADLEGEFIFLNEPGVISGPTWDAVYNAEHDLVTSELL
jgi:hypothetical protein